MRMERNGWDSCGQKSRHTNIRHFFIMDLVKEGKHRLEYCPAERMLADFFFTKPLQGNLKKTSCGNVKGPHLGSTRGVLGKA